MAVVVFLILVALVAVALVHIEQQQDFPLQLQIIRLLLVEGGRLEPLVEPMEQTELRLAFQRFHPMVAGVVQAGRRLQMVFITQIQMAMHPVAVQHQMVQLEQEEPTVITGEPEAQMALSMVVVVVVVLAVSGQIDQMAGGAVVVLEHHHQLPDQLYLERVGVVVERMHLVAMGLVPMVVERAGILEQPQLTERLTQAAVVVVLVEQA